MRNRFENYFHLTLYLALLASSAVVSVAQDSWMNALLMLMACSLHALVTRFFPDYALPRRIIPLLASFVIVYVLYDLRFSPSNEVLFVSARFVLMLQIIKLFQRKTGRDYTELLLMSFVIVCVAGVMTADFFFAPLFIVYVFTAISALIAFNVWRASESADSRAKVPRQLLTASIFLSAACCMGAGFFFLIAPRFGPASTHMLSTQHRALAGFSERVNLTGTGRIETNPAIAFRVKIDGPMANSIDPQKLLWRGMGLNHFNGAVWTPQSTGIRQRQLREASVRRTATDPDRMLVQQFELAPSDTQILFGLSEIQEVASQDFTTLYAPDEDSYLSNARLRRPARYEARSELPPERAVYAAELPGNLIGSLYLQLPDNISPRIRQLALEIASPETHPTILSRVEAIERHLADLAYTTDLPGAVDDPLEDFLFSRRAGHCELFASAMAVMLRCVNVPARLVNGYIGGEWNEFLEVYVVRQAHAHAWVEVYFPGLQQWVPFDPTPEQPEVRSTRRVMMAYARRVLDFLRIRWADQVIYYGDEEQAGLGQIIDSAFGRALARLNEEFQTRRQHEGTQTFILQAIVAILIFVVLFFAVARLCNVNIRFLPNKFRRSRIKFYEGLLRFLRKRGHLRQPAQTPLEFARLVIEREGPHWHDVEYITQIFCKVRYNGLDAASAADAEHKAVERLRALKAAVKT